MVELEWMAPPGWPVAPAGFVPDASFRPDVDRYPPVPPGWDFWGIAGGVNEEDRSEFVRVGLPRRLVPIWQLPPEPPEHPPMRWVAPPNWPQTPEGWVPPASWKRPRGWPKEPPRWQFWQVDLREHEAKVERWRTDREEMFDRLTQTRLGFATLINFVESKIMLRNAQAQLLIRPVPAFAYFVGGDISAPERTAQYEVQEQVLAALGEMRSRTLAVARGNFDWQQAHLNTWATYCAELMASSDELDQRSLDLALQQVSAKAAAAVPNKPKPRLIAAAQVTLAAAELAVKQGQEQFDAVKHRAETWAGKPTGTSQGRIDNWQDAEEVAAAHMRGVLGYEDARITGAGTDNGIDVTSLFAVAQVKHLTAPVGQPDVQRLVGANETAKTMLFYSSSGYSKIAIEYAERSGVALFRFVPPGSPVPVSTAAHQLLEYV